MQNKAIFERTTHSATWYQKICILHNSLIHTGNGKVENGNMEIRTCIIYIESCIEIKIKLNFVFTLLCSASKGFMKAFEAFIIKHFEAPQGNVKIKI